MNLIPDQIQKELIEYLNGFDAYDFQFLLPDFMAEVKGEDELDHVDTQIESLDPETFAEFEKWAQERSSEVDTEVEFGAMVPAYLMFDRARAVPPKSWLVHFTKESFDAFDRGATLERLALSTHFKNPVAADCPNNLSDEIGGSEVVFGFAYEIDRLRQVHQWRERHTAVVFQCDYAVVARHSSDEEYQVIFPLCTEYNLIQLRRGAWGRTWTPTPVVFGEVDYSEDAPAFDSINDALDWVLALGQDAARYGFIAPSKIQELMSAKPRANRSPV